MAVWLTMLPSARITASNVADLESDYPYIYWIRDYNTLVVSKKALTGTTFGSSTSTTTSIKVMPYPYQTWFESTTKDVLYAMTISGYSRGDAFSLIYNPITGWEAEYPSYIASNALGATPTSYTVAVYIAETQNRYTYSNGVTIPSGFYNAGSSLPDDIPDIENINDAINNALNATTNVTTQAVTINNNINNTYNTYQSGGITEAEFNAAMDEYREQLESLSNNSGATLADQMAVNNALTNLDITINQQVNNISPDLSTIIERIRAEISGYYNTYTAGNLPQETAINNIKKSINDGIKDTNSFTSTADRTAINGVIEYANQLINSITSYSDLDRNVSNAAESSDQAEKDYLNDLKSETSASIQDISPKNEFTDSELGAASNIMQIIWDNQFVKSLLVICGCFMVVCVVLGVKYKV